MGRNRDRFRQDKFKARTNNNELELSCIYFNARSIVNKLSELELLITNEMPDIVGISETWLHENIGDNEINFDGYTLIRKDRNSGVKRRGGG